MADCSNFKYGKAQDAAQLKKLDEIVVTSASTRCSRSARIDLAMANQNGEGSLTEGAGLVQLISMIFSAVQRKIDDIY